MQLNDLHELRAAPEQAVIINCGTRLPTTLALLSALRHAGMPVLIIDCESKDDSLAAFTRLLDTYDFDLLSAPLQSHGRTLDWLFQHVRCEKLLLVDSDLELLGPEILVFMRQFIDDPITFGAGFINGPGWLTDQKGLLEHAYYQERPWMPLVMFKVALVREALREGYSFVDRVHFNDFVSGGFLTRAMRRAHETLPILSRLGLHLPEVLRSDFYGWKPEIVFYDTGAEIFQHLKYRREKLFAGIPAHFHERYVTHFIGVSRHVLMKGASGGTPLDSIHATVVERLRQVYGTEPSG